MTLSPADLVQRELCHTLFDAIERTDVDAVGRCYAPGMTMWFNVTGEVTTREENLDALVQGAGLHRRRTYNDRVISTFADGFVVQYTLNVVGHDGTRVALSACLVAEVHDGRIVRLMEYLDAGKFPRRPRRPEAAS